MGVERWLPVVDWEDRYEVSSEGRVRSKRSGRVLRTSPNPRGGHLRVKLCRPGVQRTRTVHQIVLEAFVGPRPTGLVARHYPDPDPTNNRVENLRWGTNSENTLDKVEHGNHPFASRTECPQGHEYTPENTQIKRSRSGGVARSCLTCHRDRERTRRELRSKA